jgi:uncharacterized protein YecT (DUF1311 family)
VAIPAGPLDSAVVVVKRPFGYAARVATAVAVIAIIATLGLVLLNRRGDETTAPRTTAGEVASTKSDAGGEVVPPVPPVPTQPNSYPSTPVTGTIVPNSTPATVTPPPAASAPVIIAPTNPAPVVGAPPAQMRPLPPVTRRTEPPGPTAPSRLPDLVTPAPRDTARPVVNPPDTVTPPVVTVVPPKPADVCDSPDSGDQQKCLMSAIERNDRELNSAYQRLIAALRRQAGIEPSDPDPASVDELREAQRRWIDSRDAACRDAGSGPLFARARGECFAGQSSRRANELLERLRSIP